MILIRPRIVIKVNQILALGWLLYPNSTRCAFSCPHFTFRFSVMNDAAAQFTPEQRCQRDMDSEAPRLQGPFSYSLRNCTSIAQVI
jgi:hypothetical protein